MVYSAPIAPDAVREYYHPDADEAFGDAGADADVFRTYLPNYWMYDPDRADFSDVMAGHVVTLVGWDDSYSRWNFAIPLVREDATDADVRVYVGLTDPDDPESGTLAREQRAQMEMGCRTLKLDSPVTLSEGESYSVVVSMSAELGDGEMASVLPLECSENAAFGDEVQIYSSEGESFVSRSEGGEDGVWVDTADVALASGARVGNLAVKAFSNPVADSGDGGGTGGGGGQGQGQGTGDDQAGGGQIGEDASAQRPAADVEPSARSDREPLAAASDGSPRPLPLAMLGACALACPVVLLVRRRLSSR